MSDYYHHFLSSMAGMGEHHNPNTQDASPTLQHTTGIPHGSQPPSNPYQNLGYFTGFPEPIMFNSPKAQRSRRKSAPGLDHIKHRRTRSGCYTCRSRRVKCDEAHPVCERCRKGKRECLYPDPPAAKGASSQSSKDGSGPSQQTSPSSSRDDDDDEMDQDAKLEPILDEDEGQGRGNTRQRPIPNIPPRRASTTSFSRHLITSDPRQGSETPSQEGTKSSSSPSVSAGATSGLTPAALQSADFPLHAAGARPDWTFLPQELQFYLGHFYENITHYHYCMVSDAGDFFRSILPSIAIRDEALLYAIVGFSAYHHTLKNPAGQIKEFLQYYNRSVTLLLGFLKRREKHNIGTLLTILQLATIEEYLGDWVSLMGHQRAAHEVLTQLFTPESAMQSSTGRMILAWYARFDVFVGMMGRFEPSLPRVWFSTFVEYCDSQVVAEPEKVSWKTEACSARLRLISMEMSILFGKEARAELTGDAYFAEHQRLSKELQDWKDGWDPALTDPAFLLTEFSDAAPPYPNDIVNPFAPGVLFRKPLFASTLLTCEWHSIVIMHESQAGALAGGGEQSAKLAERAYAICQIFEAIELWPDAPNGSLFVTQACLAIAALFVPRDARHHMWIRRKFALLEVMGYIFPLTMRTRMAELFGDQACIRWWLPDGEGFTPILKNLRMFADERNATAVTAQTENLREIRHIFETMRLAGSMDSPATTMTDDGTEQHQHQQSTGKGKGPADWGP